MESVQFVCYFEIEKLQNGRWTTDRKTDEVSIKVYKIPANLQRKNINSNLSLFFPWNFLFYSLSYLVSFLFPKNGRRSFLLLWRLWKEENWDIIHFKQRRKNLKKIQIFCSGVLSCAYNKFECFILASEVMNIYIHIYIYIYIYIYSFW